MAAKLVRRALAIAVEAHKDQKRKGDGSPYIGHPVAVALMLASAGFTEQVIAAALTHDVLEDTDYPEEKLIEELGREVVEIVKAVTKPEDKSLSWEDSKLKYIETVRRGPEGAKAVCVADKIHNLGSLLTAYEEQGDAIWGKFNRGREVKLWFEKKVLEMLQATWRHPLVDEYRELLERFEKAT